MRGAEGAAAAGRDDTVYWCLRRRGTGVSAVAAGICELLVQARARGREAAGAVLASDAGLGCWLCWLCWICWEKWGCGEWGFVLVA